MKTKTKISLVISLIIFWSALFSIPGSTAETTPSPYSEAIKEFESFLKERMSLDRVPGLSVGFIKGNFTWAKGFGCSDLENNVSAAAESAYRLASVTKTITALAVLQLVEAGKIDLDAEVQTYVPYFPKKKWPLTPRLLLGHLGGVSHYKNYAFEGRIKVHKNTKEALAIFQNFDLVAEPGTKYNYSSYGFNLLGAIIEGASGEPYGSYIKEHIFKPLDMKDSRMDDPVELVPNRVRGYRLIDGEIKNSEYVDVSSRFAGGGTRSTVVDLLKYARGIIEGKLLKQETWRQMFTSMATREGYFTGYGMGWGVRPWRGHFQISHGGSQPETRTHIILFPAESFAIAIAANMEGVNLMPYVRRLAELVLDEDLDSFAYVPDKKGQAIYNGCDNVFSFGLSYYNWHQDKISLDEKEVAEAFAYFHQHLNKEALQKDFKAAKKKIADGFHPLSNQALIKVGAFIASSLKESLGKEKLDSYYRSGPLAFFSDYIEVSKEWPSSKKNYRLSQGFCRLISQWEKDWKNTYSDFERRLSITAATDFDELGEKLKKTFSGAAIYPDFTSEMENVGRYYLKNNESDKAFKVFNLGCELYPSSPSALSSLAAAHLWTGNGEEARKFFRRAFELDPDHPSLSTDRLFSLASELENAKKLKEIFSLADVVLELYPTRADLYREVGDMYLKAGEKEKAVKYYRRALELDPTLEEVKKALEKIEKEK